MKTCLEHKDEERKRFWEIDRAEESCGVHIRYGRVDTKGTAKAKTFNTPTQAQAYHDKQLKAKLKEGYAIEQRVASTAPVTPAKDDSPLARLLCSPGEESQKRGLEWVEALLQSDPDAIDVPALVLFAYTGDDHERLKSTAIRKEALRLVQRLPRLPRELEAAYYPRYVKYICEYGTRGVIERLIELSLDQRSDEDRVTLSWGYAHLHELPGELAHYPQITKVHITDACLNAFPSVLFDLPKLRHLNLAGARLADLPVKIAALQPLEELILSGNALSALPDEIGQLKHLRLLNLGNNRLEALPESLAELANLERIRLYENPMHAPNQVERLIEGFFKNKTDVATRRIQINLIFARHARACALADTPALIEALDTPSTLVRANALIALGMSLEAAYRAAPLGKGARLAVVGKCGLGVQELKSRLEPYGIDVGTRIGKQTTHVLLGERPGKRRDSVLTFQGVLLTEDFLMGFLHDRETPLFLDTAQETGEVQANIGELLMSEDQDNQRLGVEMLKGTGVSRELMTPLYLAYRLARDKPMRDAAKALLLQNASAGFVQIINKQQNFRAAGGTAVNRYLKELEHHEDIDTSRLARLCCSRMNVGLKFLFEHGDSGTFAPALAARVDAEGVLDLSHEGLDALPEALGRIEGLSVLRLTGNALTRLPESLGDLKRLTELVVSYNRLTRLPDSLGGLQQLKRLNVSYNKLSALPESLGGLAQLVDLDVSHNTLTTLPGSLDHAPHLERLDVSDNTLTALPRGLSALRELHADDNRLHAFPEGLLASTALCELWIDGNAIEALPTDLSALSRLKILRIGWKTMRALPPQIATLSGLQFLNVVSTRLESLPPELTALKHLDSLNLCHCGLRELPQGLAGLAGLRSLDLSGNALSGLPEDMSGLTALRSLDVSDNRLQGFPEVVLRLSQLEELTLRDSGDFELPEALAGLHSLNTLIVNHEHWDRAQMIMPDSCRVC